MGARDMKVLGRLAAAVDVHRAPGATALGGRVPIVCRP
jgi:hypothetical protein